MWPGPLGAIMMTSTFFGGVMVLKWMLAVSEGQGLALGHVGGDLAVVDVSAQPVGNQHHNNVAGLAALRLP